ncbi:site-specific integrase [Rhodococcus erythropolis]
MHPRCSREPRCRNREEITNHHLEHVPNRGPLRRNQSRPCPRDHHVAGTGCRISELVAIRWEDINFETKRVMITGQIIRVRGEGLIRREYTKSEAGDDRDLALPEFAMTMLRGRSQNSVYVFESLAGTILDLETIGRRCQIRAALGLEWVTSHTFRKSVATILDEEGLTARQAADQLGHAQVSMTQDVYFGRGKVHTAAADALDAAVSGKKPGRESGT